MNRYILNQFPKNKSGCYIIRNGSVVLYVGQSKNLRKRWYEHHNKNFVEVNFPKATVQIVLCSQSELIETEERLISELKPVMNNKYGDELLKATGVDDNWHGLFYD